MRDLTIPKRQGNCKIFQPRRRLDLRQGTWKFSRPPGDPISGRERFAKLECYGCHAVKGRSFRRPVETSALSCGDRADA
jgi:hypothetical protein